jgi:heparosan-N-sulfate-glucuronate 5-epimerase
MHRPAIGPSMRQSRRLPRLHAGSIHSWLLAQWSSAFSRGAGYEAQPPGSYFETDRVRGYFIDFRAKTTSPSASAPEELLPTGLAQLALGFWERMLAGDARAAAQFDRVCALIEQSAERRGEELRWRYDISSKKYGLEPPLYSAMAQAQIASVLVRAYALHGEARHAEAALGAIRPLLDPSSDLVAETADGPVLEEAPSEPPSQILNGWIYALWGLWEVDVSLGNASARAMLADSTDCLRSTLPQYDVGWWTKYSLYPHVLPDLAKPFYHRLHVDQLEILYRLTGHSDFAETARRWRGYDTPSRRIACVAQKALFVASRYA